MPRFAIHKQQIFSEEEQNSGNYYLRLEVEESNTLKSWKILWDMPLDSGNYSRATLYQQDLPLMYLYIENNPEEERFSSGTDDYKTDMISLWDTGTYEIHKTTPPYSITEQIRNGGVELFFAGAKLFGRFSLVRRKPSSVTISKFSQIKGADDNNTWYFSKEHENDRVMGIGLPNMRLPSQQRKTVANEQTQLTTAADLPKRLKATTFSTIIAPFPRRIEPMLATPVDGPFDNDQWIFEFKWDGVR